MLPESFNVNSYSQITRSWFGWPNSLFAELLMKRGQCEGLNSFEERLRKLRGVLDRDNLKIVAEEDDFLAKSIENLRREDVVLPERRYYPEGYEDLAGSHVSCS